MLLLLVRVYFALSPSYLHPDENFQGPEVFAGESRSPALRLHGRAVVVQLPRDRSLMSAPEDTRPGRGFAIACLFAH